MRRIDILSDTETGRFDFRYSWNGELHRAANEGPARIKMEADGRKLDIEYYWRGKLHRVGGPAVSRFNDQGALIAEAWYRHGLLHRSTQEGPAWTKNTLDGAPYFKRYYINGENYRDPAEGPCREYLFRGKRQKSYSENSLGPTPPRSVIRRAMRSLTV